MTKLELAKETRDALYWGLHAIRRQNVPTPTEEQVPPVASEAMARMFEVWKREVNILEAAEKADEPPPTSPLFERVAVLERCLNEANVTYKALKAILLNHTHTSTTSGPVYSDPPKETNHDRDDRA